MAKVSLRVLALVLLSVGPRTQSEDVILTDDLASFLAEVIHHVFNATRVEVLVASKYIQSTALMCSKMHSYSITTTTVRISSRNTSVDFVKRVYRGMPTNTKFYVICLLSHREYLERIFPEVNSHWTHLIHSYWIVINGDSNSPHSILQQKPCTFYFVSVTMQGYLLLGPSSAKRNNCSGLLTIAERMMDAASHIKISPPAKEERSNVLVLTCGAKGVLRMKEVFCYPPSLEEFLQVMENYINITHRLSVIARVPRVSDDLFPEEDTYSGQMTHGITDMRFSYVAINERRAFSTDFLFPLDYYKMNYIYPSPRMLKSSFTVLNIFSVTTWCFWLASITIIAVGLQVAAYVVKRVPPIACVEMTSPMYKNAASPPISPSERFSVRTLLAMHLLLVFIMSHCFTGGYISFLNKPTMEEVPDTKEKLLAFLQKGRLEPCVVRNMFEHMFILRSAHPSAMSLRNTVKKWSPFVANDTETCARRTRLRRAVFFCASMVLDKYISYLPGQAQLSREYAADVMLPVSLLLPKASPYKEPLDYAVIRMVETGLIEKLKGGYWKRTLPRPSIVDPEGDWQRLQFNMSVLPFIILLAGLGVSCVALIFEIFRGRVKERQRR